MSENESRSREASQSPDYIGRQAYSYLESGMGGVIGTLSGFGRLRYRGISTLIAVAVALSACTGGAPEAPPVEGTLPTEEPTVAASPVSPTQIEQPTTVVEVPTSTPISPEYTEMMKTAGYVFDESTGQVRMEQTGYVALVLQNGKWLDTRTGVETPLEALRPVAVNAKDWQGKEIGSILTRQIEGGGIEFYNPVIDAWQTPMDTDASVAAVSRNNIPKNLDNWKAPVEVRFDDIQVATWDDFHSQRQHFSELLGLDPIDPNANVLPLVLSQTALHGHKYVIDQYQLGFVDATAEEAASQNVVPPEYGNLWYGNDSREIVSVYRMQSPVNGEWVTVTGTRFQYQGKDLILHVFSADELLKPVEQGGAYWIMEQALSYPASRILMPVIAAWKGESCEPWDESLGWALPSQTVCDLVGYDNLDEPGALIPPDVHSRLYGTESDMNWEYASGDWVFKLQGTVMPGIVEGHMGKYYHTEWFK